MGLCEGFVFYYRWINYKINLFLGVSFGIGVGIVILFCKLGVEVVIIGRNVENLFKIVDECEKSNGKKVIIIRLKKMWIFVDYVDIYE